MTTMTVNDAISAALAEEMQRDPTVMIFGEGVATKRRDLLERFGAARVRNTPLAEGIIAGTAAGAAATGLRPVVDLLFAPFLCYAMDEIVNSAGKLRYISGGQFNFPMVVLAMTGAGWGVGAQHNHNVESWFVHSPGLKIVMPSTPADFKGLMKSAIRDDNPVLVFADIALGYSTGEVPEEADAIPLGKAAVRRGPRRDAGVLRQDRRHLHGRRRHAGRRRHRRRSDRPAQPEAAGRGRHPALRRQDRPSGGRA